MLHRLALPLALLVATPACWIAHEQGHPYAATPQRPTVSSDTNTTAEGTFELESGAYYNPHDETSTAVTLKWGASERTELFVGDAPYVKLETNGTDTRGRSDTFLGVRHRFMDAEEDGGLSLATQFVVDMTDGTRGVGNEEYDFLWAGIASGGLGRFGWTAYYEYGQVGEFDGDGHDSRHVATIAVGTPLDDRWSAFGELAASKQHSFEPVQLILGTAWSEKPGVVWDMSLRGGLNDDAGDDVAVLAGVTINFGERPTARDPRPDV